MTEQSWQTTTFWTDERVAELKQRWAAGESCSQIATAMGAASRNAIIGKVHRLGLCGRVYVKPVKGKRQEPIKTDAVPRPKRNGKAKKMRTWQGVEITDLPIDQPTLPTWFEDLEDHHCRWPCSGEGLQTVFCGDDAIKGLPYCARHCRMAYTPGRRITREEFETEAVRRRRQWKAQAA